MKNTKIVKWLLTMTLALTMVPAYSAQANQATKEGLKLTDMAGREVVLEEGPATEIVTLMPSDAEILFELGAGDTIVGRGTYVDYPAEEVEDIPAIATGKDLNIEEIIALDPQVVIMTGMALNEDQVKAIEEAGIPVLITDATTIDGVYEAIDLLGQVVDRQEEAQTLIDEMKATFANFQEKASQKEKPGSVYYEISPLEYGLWTAGSETFMDEIGSLLGLENIFADQKSFVEISQEQVLDKNPDYILTTSMQMDESAPQPQDEIKERQGWEEVTAVKEDHVFAIDNSAFTRPGPRLAQAIESLYQLVYGE